MYQFLNLFILIAVTNGGNQIYDRPSSIINGDLANIEDFPYFAALGFDEPEGRRLDCGGAIIRPNIILTATHCLIDKPNIKVFVGITSLEDLPQATAYEPEEIIVHPDFNRDVSRYDVGLIKLKKNITLDNLKVATIRMAYGNPPIGVSAVVMGFGIDQCTNPGAWGTCDNPGAKHLKSAAIKVVKIAGNDAIYTRGVNQYTCSGDSGGPIVYDGEVIGVVHAGEYNDCSGYGIQAPIPYNYYWLTKHMNC